MLRRLEYGLIVCCLLLLGACDRGEGSGGVAKATEVGGVAKATELGALSSEEADAFCEHMSEELTEKTVRFIEGEMRHIECFVTSWLEATFSGGGEDACQSAFDECMAEASTVDTGDMEDWCPERSAFADCEVSVGEYATCMRDTLDEAFADFSVLAALTCADLQSADGQQRIEQSLGVLNPDIDGEPDAASCVPIRQQCPALGGPQQPQLL